ncbi:MAG TPA: response regulator [Mucilaginibacter sp.]|jgi:PAS domain S-box-containing protein
MIPINILVVDYREENILTLQELLKPGDTGVFFTKSSNEALKVAWEIPVSIALIDVQIPETDGFELAEMLRSNSRTKDILVVFLIARSKEGKLAAFRYLGTGNYLYKPLDPQITLAKVESLIQLARHNADVRQKNEELQNLTIILNNAVEIVCVVDANNYHIKTINPAVERMLGYSQVELPGRSITDLAVEAQRINFRIKLAGIVKNNLSYSVFEFEFANYNQSLVWVECRVACQNKTLLFNISDISLQKNYQNQLNKLKETAERSKKAKEIFLANMSHELRTPVNGIIGLTNLLRKTHLDEQQASMIDLLEVSSRSLSGVINDILDMAKIEAGKFNIVRSPNNLHDLLRSVYGLLKFQADENNIEFSLEIAPDVPVNLMVDSLRLNQVLMNLLSNAIKFTERGYVKLNASVLQKNEDRTQLKFTVEDSGIGIPESRLSIVFDSFEQAEEDTAAKYGGTGLGLAIVKKLVELKGGELIVASQPGKGSIFSFVNWYTIAGKSKEKATFKTDKILERFENVKVLVAEDNLINQFMLSKMLKDWDIEVEMVDNGRKVIDKLQLNHYDLILMDTHMPEMNGYQAAKTIRSSFSEPKRSIPIISLSAASFDYEQEEALMSGMNDVLSKPFQPNELHRKIKKLLKTGYVIS